MKKFYIAFILLTTFLCVSCSYPKKVDYENSETIDSNSLEDLPSADVYIMVAPPDVMPGRSTEITFLNSYGWETFEATASFGNLSCGDKNNLQTVQGKKDDSLKWSVNEFSKPNGFIQIKFFDSDGQYVLSRTVSIQGQDEIYYKVESMGINSQDNVDFW